MYTHNNTSFRFSQKRNRANTGTPIYSAQNKHIGDVVGNEWRKEIHNPHMLKSPPAIANDVQALHRAIQAGAEYVVIKNTETGIIYRASISKILDKGFEVNRGFGLQRALGLSDWQQTRDPNHKDTNHTDTPTYSDSTATDEIKPLIYKSHAPTGITFNGVRQMSLFEEVK